MKTNHYNNYKKRNISKLICLFCVIVIGIQTSMNTCAGTVSQNLPAMPSGVSVQPYQYRSLRVEWSPSDGADAYRIYQYNATQKAYLPLGETDGTNYIVYEKVPGISYYFRVTALRHDGTGIMESAHSAAVHAMVGGDVLNNVTAAAPIPMFTVIDDDTRDPYSVKLFHDICVANGVRGCYAVVTSKFTTEGTDGYDTLLNQLKAYESDGFDMLLHARDHDARFLLKNRTAGWNGYAADETALLAAQSIKNGSSDMQAEAIGHPTYWVAPMGVHDEAIRNSAKGAAVECLLGVANKAYVTKNPKANSWNRWFIPRVELYGTDGAYDATKKNYQTGRHNSDRIWNTATDVKAQIDAAAANNAWVIICTHVYESEWYLPRITLTKSGSAYIAEAYGAGLTADWVADVAALSLTEDSYTFIFDKRNDVTGWFFEEGSEPQNLADYGVTVTGTPVYQSADPAVTEPDRSAFFAKRFSDVIDYAHSKGMTNVTFSEGYAHWKAIYDAAEQADACHSLSFVDGTVPTCSVPGQRAHYQCTVCGDRFSDEDGHTLLSDDELIVTANHTEGEPEEAVLVPANCGNAGEKKITVKCSACGEILSERTETIPASGEHIDADLNGQCDGCGKYMLVVPKNLAAVSAANAICLTWDAVPGAKLYSVYRYNSTKKAYIWIGETKTTAYTDLNVYKGTTYYYKVRAVRTHPSGNMYGPLCGTEHAMVS